MREGLSKWEDGLFCLCTLLNLSIIWPTWCFSFFLHSFWALSELPVNRSVPGTGKTKMNAQGLTSSYIAPSSLPPAVPCAVPRESPGFSMP